MKNKPGGRGGGGLSCLSMILIFALAVRSQPSWAFLP